MDCCFDLFDFLLIVGFLQLVSCQVFSITSVQFSQCAQVKITARINPTGTNFAFNWLTKPGDRDLRLSSHVYSSNGQVSVKKASNSFFSRSNYDVTSNSVHNSRTTSFVSTLEVRNFPKNRTVEFAVTSGSNEARKEVVAPSCIFPKDIFCEKNCQLSTPCATNFTKMCLDGKSIVQRCPANVSTAQKSMCNEVAIACSVTQMRNVHLAPVDKAIERVGLGKILPFECMNGYSGNTAEYNCSERNLFTPISFLAECTRSSYRNVAYTCAVSQMRNQHLAPVDKAIENVGLDEVLPFECMDGYSGNTAEYKCTARDLFTPMSRQAECSPFSYRNIIYAVIFTVLGLLILSGIFFVYRVGVDSVVGIFRALFNQNKKDKKKTDEKNPDKKEQNKV